MPIETVTDGAETFTCNAYLVTGATRTLVDAGAWPGVLDALRSRVDTLDRVVLTHQHSDHVGELDTVLDAFDADLLAADSHPRRTDSLADGDTVTIGDDSYEVVSTPGHAPDHVSFVSETALFSGDVVVYNDEAFDDGSFGRTDMPGQSRDRLIDSITRLLDRLPSGVSAMYAGHGDPYEGDVRAVVERALERAERREPKYPAE
jgi:glyoxylase-like metal-dependent hydrolase (beta-lactamase superfamily II)